MRTAGTPAAFERQRMIAADLFDQGKPPAEVAAALEVDGQTVRRWRRACAARGGDALRSEPHPGSKARLTDADRGRLAGLLVTGPAACGYHAGTLLRAMRFSPQKPARRAVVRDEAKVEAWRTTYWPDLAKKVPRRTA